jgi:hypothetical protein
VRWLCAAPLRVRLAGHPKLPGAEPAVCAALNDSRGWPVSARAFGSVEALAASLQAALDGDTGQDNAMRPKAGQETALARIRAGLAGLRDTVPASGHSIRQQHRDNGLENRRS